MCSPACAIQHTKRSRERKEAKERREGLARIKTKSDHMKDAQAAFNKYIRVRDAHLPCVSCGTMVTPQWAAGHYRTVASAGHLRFNEDNVHKQCNHYCNKQKSGNIVEMRKGMISRIGLDRVEAIENDNTVKKYTIDDLKAIKAEYTAKSKSLTDKQGG